MICLLYTSKQFLVPLIIKQLYDECIEFANHHGNRLDRRMYFFLDEYGTMPAFPDAEAMFSAGRSRNILQDVYKRQGHHPHIHLFVFSANPKEGYVLSLIHI